MMSISGTPITQTETLLAGILDGVRHLAWMLSKDGQEGKNYPVRVMDILMGQQQGEDDSGIIKSFDSSEDFEAALRAAKGGG